MSDEEKKLGIRILGHVDYVIRRLVTLVGEIL